jgi:hypothetical protein
LSALHAPRTPRAVLRATGADESQYQSGNLLVISQRFGQDMFQVAVTATASSL